MWLVATLLLPSARGGVAAGFRHSRVACGGRGLALMQQSPPPRPTREDGLKLSDTQRNEAEKLAEGAASFFGGLAKAAEEAADSWVNSGWQVKKRAGQIVPEIRPNAIDISERSTPYIKPEKPMLEASEKGGAGGLIAPTPVGQLATTQADELQVSQRESGHRAAGPMSGSGNE